ncbi:MAG: hypothetical protein HYX53_12855 [Chloroflexi bacterium]|nr:hypothetical protein [Chloroflexota bacterium]
MRLFAFLLPVLALLVVGAIAAGVYVAENGGTANSPASPAGSATERAGAPAPSGPQFKPDATVCQDVLRRPDPGQPRSFSALYTPRREVLGLTVVGGPAVSAQAFDAAEATLRTMFAGNDLIGAMTAQGAYVIIAEPGQGVLDLPEFGCLAQQFGQEFFTRVCGIADRADYPVATVNELDLVGDESGPCSGLNVLYHELGHLVQNWSVAQADYYEIRFLYQEALDAGKYKRQYAATNPNEYFADATQSYFLYGEPGGRRDRAWLKQYDPKLFELLDRVYSGK